MLLYSLILNFFRFIIDIVLLTLYIQYESNSGLGPNINFLHLTIEFGNGDSVHMGGNPYIPLVASIS
jgi:hypothetical protein